MKKVLKILVMLCIVLLVNSSEASVQANSETQLLVLDSFVIDNEEIEGIDEASFIVKINAHVINNRDEYEIFISDSSKVDFYQIQDGKLGLYKVEIIAKGSKQSLSKIVSVVVVEDIDDYLNNKKVRNISNEKIFINYHVLGPDTWGQILLPKVAGELGYCIEPNKLFVSGVTYQKSGLTNAQLKTVNKIANFGDYVKSGSQKDKAFTTVTIWNYLRTGNFKANDYYFVNGDTAGFDKWRDELSDYLKDIELLPSYNNQKFNLEVGEKLFIRDINNISNIEFNNSKIKLVEGGIEIGPFTASEIGEVEVKYNKKITSNNRTAYVYNSTNSQNAIVAGKIVDINGLFKLTVEAKSVEVNAIKLNENGDVVKGVEIEFSLDSEFNSVVRRITKEDGEIDPVTFTIEGNSTFVYAREVSAPKEYVLDNSVQVKEVSSGELVTFNFSNNFRVVEVHKVAKEGGEYLSGAQIELWKRVGNINQVKSIDNNFRVLDNGDIVEFIAKETTNDQGRAVFRTENIMYDEQYYVKEVEAPIGYELDENFYELNLVDATEKVILHTLVNEAIKTKITVIKIDSETEERLSNAVLKIEGENSTNIVEVITDNNGEASVYLPYGIYQLSEVSPPLNYQLSNEIITFKVSEKEQNIIFENYQRLVATGRNTSKYFLGISLFVLLVIIRFSRDLYNKIIT